MKELIYLNQDYSRNSKRRFEFVKDLLAALDRQSIKYIVINGFDSTTEEVGRDVDLYIPQKDLQQTLRMFQEQVKNSQWKHVFSRKSSAWFPDGLTQLCASCPSDTGYLYVCIDLIYKPFIYAGICQYPTDGDFEKDETIFFKNYFMKTLANIGLKNALKVDIAKIESSEYFKNLLPPNHFRQILEAYRASRIPAESSKIRRAVQLRFLRNHPLLSAKNFLLAMIRRTIAPFMNHVPVVVLLGPDGVGKSTIISKVLDQLKRNFFVVRKIHWRPQLIPNINDLLRRKKPAEQKTDSFMPRREAGKLGSLRFLYYYLDYILGYIFIAHRSTFSEMPFILYDRYLYDFFIDPKRYGIKKIRRLFFLIRFFPKPDLVILLKDSPERILSRKKELAATEIEEQYRNYDLLMNKQLIDKVYDISRESFTDIEDHIKKDILFLLEKKYKILDNQYV